MCLMFKCLVGCWIDMGVDVDVDGCCECSIKTRSNNGTVPPLYIPLPDPRQGLVNNDMLEASSNFPIFQFSTLLCHQVKILIR